MSVNHNVLRRAGACALAGLIAASQLTAVTFAADLANYNSWKDADNSVVAAPSTTSDGQTTRPVVEGVKTPVTSAVIDNSKTGSLTIHKYDITAAANNGIRAGDYIATGDVDDAAQETLAPYALKGVVFSFAKVGGIKTMYTTPLGDSCTQLCYKLPPDLADLIGLKVSEYYTSTQLNYALSSMLTTDMQAKSKLESWMKTHKAQEMEETDDSGTTTAGTMELGLYLVVEAKVPQDVSVTTEPFFVSVPMTDVTGSYWNYGVTVFPKNQQSVPQLDKLVKDPDSGIYGDSASYSEGSKVDYIIVSNLPEITSEATYLTSYQIEDLLPPGQTYNIKDVSIAFYEREDDAKSDNREKAAGVWEDEQGALMFTLTEQDDEYGSKLIINPTPEGLKDINANYSGYYMVVHYTSNLASDSRVVLGDNGNVSPVTLTYSRTNEPYRQTLDDKVAIYTYGLDLVKKFKGGKGDPEKVEFQLQSIEDKAWIRAKKDTDGVYYVTESTGSQAEATAFVPDRAGQLHIYGIDADSYSLSESKTASGFTKLKEPLTLVYGMTESKVVSGNPANTAEDGTSSVINVVNGATVLVNGTQTAMTPLADSPNATVGVTVTNKKGGNEESEEPDESTTSKETGKTKKTKGGGGSDDGDSDGGGGSRKVGLPQTGGTGKILVSVIGILVVLVGAVLVRKSKKDSAEEEPDTETESSDNSNNDSSSD